MHSRCTAASDPGPRNWMSPMCDTSNRPTPVRTAMCSATRPEYSTGMSHPPKSTIFALCARCVAFSAVLRSVAVVSAMENHSGLPAAALPTVSLNGVASRQGYVCVLLMRSLNECHSERKVLPHSVFAAADRRAGPLLHGIDGLDICESRHMSQGNPRADCAKQYREPCADDPDVVAIHRGARTRGAMPSGRHLHRQKACDQLYSAARHH